MMKIFHLHLLFNTVLSDRREESHQKKVEFLLTKEGFGCIFASFLCINIKA